MNSCDIVSLVTATSCAIAKCVSEEDIPIIASIFGQIASTLATITVIEKANNPQEPIPSLPDIIPETDILETTNNNI